jgi:hypothetical protein
MDKVKPFTGKNATTEEINAYHRKYRRAHLDEKRLYNKLWMRRQRRAKRREALQNKASRAS